ncbi:hypothetical protein ACOMHN_054339 [Nucella lapillus]
MNRTEERVSLSETSTSTVEAQIVSAYFLRDLTRTLWLTVPPVLLVLGCFGNVMTIVVMRGMRASESTACLSVYFTALAVSDLFVICNTMAVHWLKMAFNIPLTYFHDISCSGAIFVTHVTFLTSAWFLVVLTCQRLIAVLLPHRVGVLCTVRTGQIITAIIVIIACVLNVHFFFHYHVDTEHQSCGSNNYQLVNLFSFLDLFLASLIPFMILIVGNSVLIYRAMQSMQMFGKSTGTGETQTTSRSAKVTSMTVTLILTSAAFLLLSMPICIVNIYFEITGFFGDKTVDEGLRQKLFLTHTVCILLGISNSAINFYIYILSGSRFRQETKRCFRLCFKHLYTSSGW